MSDVLGLLVTGPPEKMQAFHLGVCFALNAVNRRESTTHYTCMTEDLNHALHVAHMADVTVQKIERGRAMRQETKRLPGGGTITATDHEESYPVLHLGTHEQKWGDA